MPEKSILNKKYNNLHQSPEVQKAVDKKASLEKLSAKQKNQLNSNPEAKIQAYLDRFSNLFSRINNSTSKVARLNELKKIAHNLYVIKEQDIPQSVYELEQNIARQRGLGFIEIDDQYIEAKNEEIISAQIKSLNKWIDYLSGPDAFYPDWFKYLAFTSITKMGGYDKVTGKFEKRSKGTVKAFPEIDSEALGLVCKAIESQMHQKNEVGIKSNNHTQEEINVIAAKAQFEKLYPLAIKHLENLSRKNMENRDTITGSWKKYHQGSNPQILEDSLDGYSTGWCTASGSAPQQLEVGDFYVFYSTDKEGNHKVPRIAIRMEADTIAEIRGINHGQELEPELVETMEEKAKTLNGYEYYQRATYDMKFLTEIENKQLSGEELNGDELKFLYEVEEEIFGFGYGKDPRINEIINQRDYDKDAHLIAKLDYPDALDEEIVIYENSFSDKSRYLIYLNKYFRKSLITSKLCTEEILDFLVKKTLDEKNYNHIEIINEIIVNPNCSPESLIKLFDYYILYNTNNETAYLQKKINVKLLLAHPQLPKKIYYTILDIDDDRLRGRVTKIIMKDPRLPVDIKSQFIQFENREVNLISLVNNPIVTSEDLQNLYDRIQSDNTLLYDGSGLKKAFAQNPILPKKIITQLVKNTKDKDVIFSLLTNQILDNEDLKSIYERIKIDGNLFNEDKPQFNDKSHQTNQDIIKQKIASQKNISEEFLNELFISEGKSVQLEILGNKTCSIKLVNEYIESNNFHVIEKITNNPKLTSQNLEQILQHIIENKIKFNDEFPVSLENENKYFENIISYDEEDEDYFNTETVEIYNLLLKKLTLKVLNHPNFIGKDNVKILKSLVFNKFNRIDCRFIDDVISDNLEVNTRFIVLVYNEMKKIDTSTINMIKRINFDIKRIFRRSILSEAEQQTVAKIINFFKNNLSTQEQILYNINDSHYD